MTNNECIILRGLKCCSRIHPDCENCPYNSVHCRELESDAATLITTLLTKVEYLTGIIREDKHD